MFDTDRVSVSWSTSHTTSRTVTFKGAENVMPRSRHSSTSYFGCSSSYDTNWSEARWLKSWIGNTLLNTACSPMFSRFAWGTFVWRNFS